MLFSRNHVVWILHHLQTLEEGHTPMEYSSYTELPGKRKGGTWAYFENPAGLAATITMRLEKCGFDGALVYLCYCFGRDWETVARMTGLNYYDLKRRMNRAITYISGEWPKPAPYRHYIMTKKFHRAVDLTNKFERDNIKT